MSSSLRHALGSHITLRGVGTITTRQRTTKAFRLQKSARCMSTLTTSESASSAFQPRLVRTNLPNLISGSIHNNQQQRRHQANEEAATLRKRQDGPNLSRHATASRVNGQRSLLSGQATTAAVSGHSSNVRIHTKPKERREYDSDLVVVLDMDECLIHSNFLSSEAASQWAYQVTRKDDNDNNQNEGDQEEHETSSVIDSFCITLLNGDVVRVNKRPLLEDFLKEVTDRYETHVFTAAMEVYAAPVLDALDPSGRMFAKRWYRDSCTFHNDVGAYVKDLGRLHQSNDTGTDIPLPSNRVVLVDNNPLSFIANPMNGILVTDFYDDPNDTTLEAVLELLHELNDMKDVRPILDEKFGLRHSLSEVIRSES